MFDKAILYDAARKLSSKHRFNRNATLASEATQFIRENFSKENTPVNKTSEIEDTIGVTPNAKPTGLVEKEKKDKEQARKATDPNTQTTDDVDIYYSFDSKYDIRNCLPSSAAVITNPADSPDRFDNPAVAFYVHRGDESCLPRRDAEVLSVFCNGIPTIELSRCVPYLEMTLVSFSEKFADSTQSITLAGFLDQPNSPNFTRTFPAGIPNGAKDPSKLSFYSGMELFTSPQTLVNPDSTKGLNKFAPFMTLNSVDINVISMGQAFYSYKQATVKITLHDRTRMPEIAQLLAVDLFSQNHIVLEYGWSHPDGGAGSSNEFGKLLNNMRCKEVYTVTKSGFNISADGGGAVTIDLTLSMTPGDQSRAISAASGDKVQTDFIKNALVSVLRTQSSGGTPDVQSKMTIRSKNIMSPTTLVSRDSYVRIIKMLVSDNFDDDMFEQEARAVETEISQNVSSNKLTTISGILSSRLIEIINLIRKEPAKVPFYEKSVENNQAVDPWGVYIPLGALIYAFLAYPLGSSCKFDEIQIHTYQLNMNSLYGTNCNISEIPIPVEIINNILKKVENPNSYSLIRTILEQTLNRQDFSFYGLNDLYTKKQSITSQSRAKGPDGQDIEITPAEKDATLKQIESTENDISARISEIATTMNSPTSEFVMPDVRLYVESLPMLESGQSSAALSSRTIARIHIFDRNRSPYLGEQVMIRSLTPGEIVSTFNKVETPKDASGKAAVTQKTSTTGNASTISAAFNRSKMVEIIETNMPTIKLGNDFSTVIQLGVSANTGGALADALLVESFKNARDPQVSKGSSTGAEEVTVIPSTLNVTMFGMPLMNYGQQFFANLDTGTTADNIYVTTGLSHRISPDSFTTTLSLNPSFQGTVTSFKTALRGAISKIENQDKDK